MPARSVSKPSSLAPLTDQTFQWCVSQLAARDPTLALAVTTYGNPPLWTHPAGFSGVVIAILAQQVSLESAQATFTKLEKAIGSITPEGVLSLDHAAMRAIGFSRQKASYVRGLAQGILDGEIDLRELESMEDEQARERLVRIRGIGAWTAGTYLLFALRRADAWPSGDLGLAKAIQETRRLAATPSSEEVDQIAEQWRPWRAVAARILWHHYLSRRGRVG